ncbi:MAG: hypothetical protein LBP35_03450 [Candidatus Ancillula trichonymphae]|nr:hypothetical protein [Candidatus Ancillula trichonymphae]
MHTVVAQNYTKKSQIQDRLITFDTVLRAEELDLNKIPQITLSGTVLAEVKAVGIYAESEFVGAARIDYTSAPAVWTTRSLKSPGKTELSAVALGFDSSSGMQKQNVQLADVAEKSWHYERGYCSEMVGPAASRIAMVHSDQLTFSGSSELKNYCN